MSAPVRARPTSFSPLRIHASPFLRMSAALRWLKVSSPRSGLGEPSWEATTAMVRARSANRSGPRLSSHLVHRADIRLQAKRCGRRRGMVLAIGYAQVSVFERRDVKTTAADRSSVRPTTDDDEPRPTKSSRIRRRSSLCNPSADQNRSAGNVHPSRGCTFLGTRRIQNK